MRPRTLVAAIALAVPLVAGCRQDMHDQPTYEPLERSAFFPDGRASRPHIDGTVARGTLKTDDAYFTGKVAGQYVREMPVPVSPALLARGRERFDIYCSPCHDRVGTGGGMIVLRGYKRPPSFHIDRLRAEADGYFFDTISNGFGVMPSYAQQVAPPDRWAIVAYIRALQLSQGATIDDVPAAERATLLGGKS
jgi:mono/diheme cytochrome c family protein